MLDNERGRFSLMANIKSTVKVLGNSESIHFQGKENYKR